MVWDYFLCGNYEPIQLLDDGAVSSDNTPVYVLFAGKYFWAAIPVLAASVFSIMSPNKAFVVTSLIICIISLPLMSLSFYCDYISYILVTGISNGSEVYNISELRYQLEGYDIGVLENDILTACELDILAICACFCLTLTNLIVTCYPDYLCCRSSTIAKRNNFKPETISLTEKTQQLYTANV